ncbi:hypothetical protein LXA43DRAFT_325270 [Ganoderma leucocontextum]|nr:hypothetical protein LXA43DRAFT_325270 [Ganoderma leucocontextum]
MPKTLTRHDAQVLGVPHIPLVLIVTSYEESRVAVRLSGQGITSTLIPSERHSRSLWPPHPQPPAALPAAPTSPRTPPPPLARGMGCFKGITSWPRTTLNRTSNSISRRDDCRRRSAAASRVSGVCWTRTNTAMSALSVSRSKFRTLHSWRHPGGSHGSWPARGPIEHAISPMGIPVRRRLGFRFRPSIQLLLAINSKCRSVGMLTSMTAQFAADITGATCVLELFTLVSPLLFSNVRIPRLQANCFHWVLFGSLIAIACMVPMQPIPLVTNSGPEVIHQTHLRERDSMRTCGRPYDTICHGHRMFLSRFNGSRFLDCGCGGPSDRACSSVQHLSELIIRNLVMGLGFHT